MKKKIELDKLQDYWLIVTQSEKPKVVYEIDDERIFSTTIAGRHGTLINHSTFKETKKIANKGIKYLDTCYFSCNFKLIQVKDLSKEPLEILLSDIKSFNEDVDYSNKLEQEENKKQEGDKYRDDNAPGCWVVFSVANEYNQPERAFEALYWEKPTQEYLEENYGYLHNWWVEKFNK